MVQYLSEVLRLVHVAEPGRHDSGWTRPLSLCRQKLWSNGTWESPLCGTRKERAIPKVPVPGDYLRPPKRT